MESSLILVILVAIILLVITIYCALMSHKLIFFNDAKFRIIFKDSRVTAKVDSQFLVDDPAD